MKDGFLYVVKLSLVAGTILFLVGCSQTPDSSATTPANETAPVQEEEFDFSDPRDPLEDFNRPSWQLTRDVLDPYIIWPAASAYGVAPKPLRRGLYNMTENITEPASIVNNLLQRKPKAAAISAGRFVMNSTFGVFGIFDVATKMGVMQEKESFGETLAVYGVPDGPYIMLPGIGPTVIIDRGGDTVDDLIWVARIFSLPMSIAQLTIRGLEHRLELRELEPMLENSIDEYAFVREAYFSYWLDKVYDGNPPLDGRYDDLDDWENGWDDDWSAEPEPSESESIE
ncbi:surface lipoprotein [Idiomarina sp. A28L]|uniref:MlaA family lipoprotein n=1 Tax=Idiomarina sp. A28L TaxID=1036674 RepID=UPI0002138D5F|nr:VacJ family lipoprotein [Idiomarina sp. A28L]EGN74668.1 surface lipoprotein [Idiomarina sp. A28L]